MEDRWPSSVGPRGQALNHRMLRWLKTVVVSDTGKGALDRVRWGDQEDVPESVPTGETVARACAVEASKQTKDGIEIGGPDFPFEISLADTRLLARRCPA
jgi:hypothetical protein